jgi:hypothetical protein
MANNRIIIGCKKCNDWISLAKYYPGSGWYLSTFRLQMHHKDKEYWDKVNTFLDTHSHDATMEGDEHLVVEFEMASRKDGFLSQPD